MKYLKLYNVLYTIAYLDLSGIISPPD